MKKTTKTLAGLLLVLTLSLTVFSGVAAACDDAEGNRLANAQKYEQQQKHGFMDHDKETRKALKEAVMNSDYDAWYALISEVDASHPFADFVTEDNFSLFAEMIQARMNGDHETAREIRDELGLKLHSKN